VKFANPINDIAFKKIFGDKNHSKILISFLNSTLDFEGDNKIKSITIANPYQVPKIEELKSTILDINAIDNKDNHFVVEMQVEKDKEFAKRSLYYTSKSYVNQIDKGDEYKKLKKVYFIGILDFAIFDNKDYISNHLILDEKTKKQELKDFEFTFIELEKFNYELSKCDTTIKKWVYFIKNASSFEMIPKEYEDISEFKQAFEIAKQYNWSKEEMKVYDYVFMQDWKAQSIIDTAKEDGWNEGIKAGMESGLKEGMEKGMEKGIKEGIKKEKIEIAKNLLDILDDETISMKTRLSIDDIKKLRN
jgi:predicted transposase/invertase (TIGR01784 family)